MRSQSERGADGGPIAETVTIACRDGYSLGADLWSPAGHDPLGVVIVNAATGVCARYYHPYARFLADQGFAVVTYDYRGIGASRPPSLRHSAIRWRDWGELDFDAVVRWARAFGPGVPLMVVGHSIGGFLPGYAAAATSIDRVLTVGAQYAYWRDYAASRRWRLLLKWHLAMPAITAAVGYFPGRRLGWLEDLPPRVVGEWSLRGARFEDSYPRHERQAIVERFAAVRAPILAVGVSDDEFATLPALLRGLAYYARSERSVVVLKPGDLGFEAVGHFGLFHARHREGFWPATCRWLRDGVNPWPVAVELAAGTEQKP